MRFCPSDIAREEYAEQENEIVLVEKMNADDCRMFRFINRQTWTYSTADPFSSRHEVGLQDMDDLKAPVWVFGRCNLVNIATVGRLLLEIPPSPLIELQELSANSLIAITQAQWLWYIFTTNLMRRRSN